LACGENRGGVRGKSKRVAEVKKGKEVKEGEDKKEK
jgi:hypothetical protein